MTLGELRSYFPCRFWRQWVSFLLLLLPVFFLFPARATEEEKKAEQKLALVRAEIQQLTQEIVQIENERRATTVALRAADQAVGKAARDLRRMDSVLQTHAQRLQELEQRHQQMAARLSGEREVLAALLRAAYALGRHQELKLFLAQDKIDQAMRALAYQRYFQRDRLHRIAAVTQQLAGLAQLGTELENQRQWLFAARQQRAASLAQLQAQQAQRTTLLAGLDSRYRGQRERLTALGRDEKALVKLLERLRDIFADIPDRLDGAQPFASLRGTLPWPLAGQVQAGYGGTLADGRRSSGWLLTANAGDEARAISHGRVAFSDWLRGYGLIVIIDHGEGYMSLYAQNDALLKEAGDWVQANEPIAIAGHSGGQKRTALYFELRHNGRAVDPAGWLRHR